MMLKEELDIQNHKLEIEGERIRLRKLKLSDSDDICRNLKDREMVKWMLNVPYPFKKQDAIKWIRKTHYKMRNKKEYSFGIVLKNENK